MSELNLDARSWRVDERTYETGGETNVEKRPAEVIVEKKPKPDETIIERKTIISAETEVKAGNGKKKIPAAVLVIITAFIAAAACAVVFFIIKNDNAVSRVPITDAAGPQYETTEKDGAPTAPVVTSSAAAVTSTSMQNNADQTTPDKKDTADPVTGKTQTEDVAVSVGSQDQYHVNIFLSNFSEIIPICYACDTIEEQMLFVMKHKYVNGFDIYLDGDTAYLPGQKMRNNLNYFFRSSVSDGSFGAVRYDEDDDFYSAYVSVVSSDGAVSYGKPYRFSVAENAVPVSGDGYRVSYSIYESSVPCDDGCYSLTPYEAASDPDLKKIGGGEALLGIDQEGLYFK